MKKLLFFAGLCIIHVVFAVQSGAHGMQPPADHERPTYLWVDGRSHKDFQVAQQALIQIMQKRLLTTKIRRTYIYCGMPMNVHDSKYHHICTILAAVTNSHNLVRAISFDDDSIVITESCDR